MADKAKKVAFEEEEEEEEGDDDEHENRRIRFKAKVKEFGERGRLERQRKRKERGAWPACTYYSRRVLKSWAHLVELYSAHRVH